MKSYLVVMFLIFLLDIAAKLDILRKGTREYSPLTEAVSIIADIGILLWTVVLIVELSK